MNIELYNEDIDEILDELKAKNHWTAEIPYLHEFIMTAKPAVVFRYFVGYHLESSILSREIRKQTYNFAVKGVVYLWQRRFKIDPNMFEYMCVKASVPPKWSLVPWSEDKIANKWKRKPAYEQKPSKVG